MAYTTGSASTLADLLAAFQGACSAGGWTVAGNVIYRGTCYAELKISGSQMVISGGTGKDGSNNLTGVADTPVGYMGVPSIAGQVPVTPTFAPPFTYFAHVFVDEVYLIVNYAVNYYEMVSFGKSAMPGLVGSGNWYCGNYPANNNLAHGSIGEHNYFQPGGYSLFCRSLGSAAQSFGVHHAMDSATWAAEGSWRDWASIFFRQPNAWNGESVLIPNRVYASRPSGFISPVLECANARLVNIANLDDEQIITLGPDKWKVYPWWRRGTPFNASAVGGTYTGVAGHAIRYDGP